MKMKIIILIISLIFEKLFCCVFIGLQEGIIKGRLARATNKSDTFYAFQQIPYASPPIGALRFQPPQAVKKWQGILDTTKNTKVCYQIGTNSDHETEDCLYLNVYTPKTPNTGDKSLLPVVIFIHGGGFIIGDATHKHYGPEFLIQHEIVIVTINYRVGVFGFLSTQDEVVPGNNGLKDQLFALQWINKNIQSFGGDSSKITIMGQSAGASSVGYHLISKQSRGLYRAAIMQSGSSLSSFGYQRNPRKYAVKIASLIDDHVDEETSSKNLLNVLVNADAAAIDALSENINVDTYDNAQLFQGYYYAPVLEPESDEAFLTEKQFEIIERGDADRVPVLMGINSEESLSQSTDLSFLARLMSLYDNTLWALVPHNMNIDSESVKNVVGEGIRKIYSGNELLQNVSAAGVFQYMSDTTFTRAVIKHAELQSKYSDVYFYQFSYDGVMGNISIDIEGAERVGHNEENAYLWRIRNGMFDNYNLGIYPESDLITQKRLLTLWTNFVKTLNPTPGPSEVLQNVIWPTVSAFNRSDFPYLYIGDALEIKYRPKEDSYYGWIALYEEFGQPPYDTY